MNVSLCVLGRLDLDNQVDAGDIEAARCDVSGDEDTELFLLEALEGDFTLVLGNVAVHHLNVFLDLLREKQVIGLLLGGSEHDNLATSVANEDVSKSANTVLVWAVDGQMLHGL